MVLIAFAGIAAAAVFASMTPAVAAPSTAISPGQLRAVGSATQVIEVTASNYTTSYATLTAWTKTSGHWKRTFGPWQARVGSHGFARRGDKREGDLQTPSGTFSLPFAFGVDADPGTKLHWRQVHSYDYWDDDSSSPRYNLWTDIDRHSAGRDPEPMDDLPVYEYGVVVGYNTARTPDLGSAIFLHVDNGKASVGCVTVTQANVIKLLRWLRPSDHPRIAMGPLSAIEAK